jgi:3-dehydroquinate dehydratase/shikimate dehydrogenase
MAEALAGLPRIREAADCVELRLDLFEEAFDLPELLAERGELPVVVTLRPAEQGGRSRLPPGERLDVLMSAAELGAEYIDLEWDLATHEAIAALRTAGARVLVSRHDFGGMPADFAEGWWAELAALGADVIKIVGTAQEVRDGLPVFRAFRRADRHTVAMAMGLAGLPTRVLALREDQCLLAYAMLSAETATAPGQLSLTHMREVYHADRLGPHTRAYGLLGPQPEHARAAEYNAWFAEAGSDAVAVPFPATADAAGIVSAYTELPVAGWHVHGDELQHGVGQAVDTLAPSACRQGKVNAITTDAEGKLVGHWVESPRAQFDLWQGSPT